MTRSSLTIPEEGSRLSKHQPRCARAGTEAHIRVLMLQEYAELIGRKS